MASLLPIISDLAPLVLPSSVHIVEAPTLPTPQERELGQPVTIPIISGKSKKLYTSIVQLPPSTNTSIRHHGEADIIIHVLRGLPSLFSNNGGKVTEAFLSLGSFVLIPAWTEHQIQNGSEVEEVVLLITGSGKQEAVVELNGWGGKVLS